MEKIDTTLKRLNLGVSAWLKIKDERDEDGNWNTEELGYTKVGNRWCVALRVSSGTLGRTRVIQMSIYGLSQTRLAFRMRAVSHICDLIDCLRTEADKMIEQLEPRVQDLTQITDALDSLGGCMLMINIVIAGIIAFLVVVCIALLRNDQVRVEFGSSFFHFNLETQRKQKRIPIKKNSDIQIR